ncbi:MAG: hypothetical protein WCK77_03915 [Verrucomicrobiota bacterium]
MRRNQSALACPTLTNTTTTMGDKSPKANQKKSSQKQTKTNTATQAKKQAAAKKP